MRSTLVSSQHTFTAISQLNSNNEKNALYTVRYFNEYSVVLFNSAKENKR